jgi:hypothetical protein
MSMTRPACFSKEPVPFPRGKAIEDSSGVVLLPVTPNVCDDLGRCERTVKRWLNDQKMGMPRALRIRNRLYLVQSEYERWKRGVLLTALDQGAGNPGSVAAGEASALAGAA